MREVYAERRRLVLKYLNDMPHLQPFKPKGAFYVWVKIDPELDMSSEDFANWLLDNARVVVIPGTAFGKQGEGWLRISYATKKDKLIEAMERMREALSKL
jgi:aspartate aminotransferase